MRLALQDVATLVEGRLAGDGRIWITGASILRDASPGDVTLVDRPKLLSALNGCSASAVILPEGMEVEGVASVAVSDVRAAFAKVVEVFRPAYREQARGVSASAYVSATARLGDDVVIHPGVTVGDFVEIGSGCVIHAGAHLMAQCRVGRDTQIFPNVVLYENTVIGDRVRIHANAVIGAYGFGYETVNGRHESTAQLGYVEVASDVEIGAGTTIDRGTYGPTRVGEGTKIDNLVQVGHNCRIGRHNLICSQVGIAGSCTTGDFVVMGGQVGLRDHVDIGSQAMLGAKAGVMSDIPAQTKYVGIPATPEREQMVKQAAWSKLPEMRKELRSLRKRVEQLSAQLEQTRRPEAA
jgi:UDP-3-O-[3-hydroxymyristoyl] glucosamine N-acyltransferase